MPGDAMLVRECSQRAAGVPGDSSREPDQRIDLSRRHGRGYIGKVSAEQGEDST
jgi:hypothetical protein